MSSNPEAGRAEKGGRLPLAGSPGSSGSVRGRETLLEIRSPVSSRPVPPRTPEAPEVVQAFVSRHRPFFILLAVLVAQLVLLSVQITRDREVPLAKVWAASALAPFERSLAGLAYGAGGAWGALRNLKQAERQNRGLSVRLAAEDTQIRSLSGEAAENGRLRSLLDFKSRVSYATVAAEVIGASPGEGPNTLLIDKGADAGLVDDMPVITPDGIAGKIVAVYPHSAQVLLITDPSAGAGGLVEKSRSQGVLKGVGHGQCRLNYIANEDGVSVGDLVVTSGLDGVYPKELPLGRVAKVANGSIYKEIVVKPAASLDRLEEVLVVTSKPAGPVEAKAQRAR